MTLAASKFGSKCKLSEEFIKKVTKSGVVDNVLSFAKFKEQQQLKKTDGHKRMRSVGALALPALTTQHHWRVQARGRQQRRRSQRQEVHAHPDRG